MNVIRAFRRCFGTGPVSPDHQARPSDWRMSGQIRFPDGSVCAGDICQYGLDPETFYAEVAGVQYALAESPQMISVCLNMRPTYDHLWCVASHEGQPVCQGLVHEKGGR